MSCLKRILIFILSFVFGAFLSVKAWQNAEQKTACVVTALETAETTQAATEKPTKFQTEAPTEKQTKQEYIKIKVVATAYCPCKECSEGFGRQTSTGAIATAGRTIAVDPSVIPYGSKVQINGHTYVAEDCGGDIKGKRIDIFFDTHSEADEFGRQELTVFVSKSS